MRALRRQVGACMKRVFWRAPVGRSAIVHQLVDPIDLADDVVAYHVVVHGRAAVARFGVLLSTEVRLEPEQDGMTLLEAGIREVVESRQWTVIPSCSGS